MNLNEQTNRIKKMMGLLSEDNNSIENACKAIVTKTSLDKAKQWLLSWISNPKTKQKWMTNYKKTSQEWDETYNTCVSLINGVKNFSYNTNYKDRQQTLFYVEPEYKKDTIFVVCKNVNGFFKNDWQKFETSRQK